MIRFFNRISACINASGKGGPGITDHAAVNDRETGKNNIADKMFVAIIIMENNNSKDNEGYP